MLLNIFFIVSIVLELILCLIIFYASRIRPNPEQKSLRRRFYLLGITISAWSFSQYVQYAINWTENPQGLEKASIVSIFLTIWVSFFYLLFSYELAKKVFRQWLLVITLMIGAIASIVTFFTNIVSVSILEGQPQPDYNIVAYSFATLIPLLFVLSGILILEKYAYKINSQNNQLAKQAKFVSRGMIFTTITVFAGNYVFDLLGLANSLTITIVAAAPIVFALIVGYSVFSLRLFNFSDFFYKSIAYIATLVVVFGLYMAVAVLITKYVLGINLDTKSEIVIAAFSALAAIAFQPIKKQFDKITNNIFYRDAYEAQEFLNQVNTKIVNTTDLYALLGEVAKIAQDNLKTQFCNFYIDEKASIDFHISGTNPKVFGSKDWKELDETMDSSNTKIYAGKDTGDTKVIDQMHKLGIDAIVKMVSQDLHVGYLLIGEKKSGGAISDQDVQILEIIADEVAIAVQNSLRFIEIAQFNITLQKKVEIATAELQRSNEKLKALDEAKDEFISMASHQLRTPLTSVKGYISMLQEGDAGEVNEQQRSFLDQAFLSSQRMVYLIADLLNVSRLKTGKFVIDAKPTYLPDVIESEIAQLTETVKARGLEMKFNKPAEFPTLNLDETKIRQVIMNFADNAIYYTPNGGLITIKLEATDKTIEFTVTDTGIGVPKSEQHKLFAKFYRAGNARKARPDGTGLGLFMAKKVVVAQGGAIIFKTTEGKGSTFGFSFPRDKIEIPQHKK